jgi:hypothetical protein
MKKKVFFYLLLILFLLSTLMISSKTYAKKYGMQKLLVNDFEKNQLETWEKRFLIEVENPYDYNLDNAPVIIDINDLNIVKDKSLVTGSFFVTDENMEKVALSQIDDIDGDKIKDEIVFITDIKANSKLKFYIYYSKGGRNWQFHKRYTHGIALPGWESEVFGYRSYSSFILDTFAKPKKKPNLLLRLFYDEQLQQLYNHHTESEVGMDTLNVGTTSGLAGIVFAVDNKKLQPRDGGLKSKVIVSGPVRSIVTFSKAPWKTEAGTLVIERTGIIYAHHFETQIIDTITIKNGTGTGKYGIGLRKEKIAEYEELKDDGLFIQWHDQHPSIGEHGIGIYIPTSDINKTGEDKDDHYVLINGSTKGNRTIKQEFVAFGAWKRGGYVKSAKEFKDFAYYLKQQQSPVNVKIVSTELGKK